MNRTFSLSLSLGLTIALTAGPLLQVARSERLALPWADYIFTKPVLDPVTKRPTCKSSAQPVATQPNNNTSPPEKRTTKQTGELARCVQKPAAGGASNRPGGPAADEPGAEAFWDGVVGWQATEPAEGVPVTFALSSSDLGVISGPATVKTDAQGLAVVNFQAAPRRAKGTYRVTACVPDNPADCTQSEFPLEVVGKSTTWLKVLLGAAAVGLIIGIATSKKDGGNTPIAPLPPPLVNE